MICIREDVSRADAGGLSGERSGGRASCRYASAAEGGDGNDQEDREGVRAGSLARPRLQEPAQAQVYLVAAELEIVGAPMESTIFQAVSTSCGE